MPPRQAGRCRQAMIRLVTDTGVLVSALRNRTGNEAAAGAQFLVTGNRRHGAEGRHGTAAAVNARQHPDRLAAPP